MKIDYDAIINAGAEYLSTKSYLYEKYHAPIYIGYNPPRDLALRDRAFCTAERVLWTVAEVTGIPSDVIVRAARAFNRYYDRGGERVLNAERLIKALNPVR